MGEIFSNVLFCKVIWDVWLFAFGFVAYNCTITQTSLFPVLQKTNWSLKPHFHRSPNHPHFVWELKVYILLKITFIILIIQNCWCIDNLNNTNNWYSCINCNKNTDKINLQPLRVIS
jgi:hypothetical protein